MVTTQKPVGNLLIKTQPIGAIGKINHRIAPLPVSGYVAFIASIIAPVPKIIALCCMLQAKSQSLGQIWR